MGLFAKFTQNWPYLLRQVPLLAKHLIVTTSTNVTMMTVFSLNKKAVMAVIVDHSLFTPIHIQINQNRKKCSFYSYCCLQNFALICNIIFPVLYGLLDYLSSLIHWRKNAINWRTRIDWTFAYNNRGILTPFVICFTSMMLRSKSCQCNIF